MDRLAYVLYANDEYAWAPISDNYLYQGGTSQAGPQVSGAAAVFVQYYREQYGGATPSPALVKAALINSAVDMDDAERHGSAPNMDEGWGRVDLTGFIGSEPIYEFVDQTALLTNGQVYEKDVLLIPDEPLKITLTYTDPPGFPGCPGIGERSRPRSGCPGRSNDLPREPVRSWRVGT